MGRYFLNASERALLHAGRKVSISLILSEMKFVDLCLITQKHENEELVAFIPCDPHPIAPYLDPESIFTFFSRKSAACMSNDEIKGTVVFVLGKAKGKSKGDCTFY